MRVEQKPSLVGEVHCLNCGRVLAVVVRDGIDGRLALQPRMHQSAVEVVVAGRRLLRCGHCRGRALVESFEDPLEEHAVQVRAASYALV